MQVWNVLHVARWQQDAKMTHKIAISAPSQNFVGAVSSQLRHASTIGKNLLRTNTFSTCPPNVVNFGLITAEIGSGVWGTPANFNGFRVLTALLHGSLVVGINQTLQHWTEGATYVWQGGHHIGHCLTFLVFNHILWKLPVYLSIVEKNFFRELVHVMWINKKLECRPWADVLRDGRPAEYRCRPLQSSLIPFLVPSHKVWLMPTDGVPYSNAANRRETAWNLLECRKL